MHRRKFRLFYAILAIATLLVVYADYWAFNYKSPIQKNPTIQTLPILILGGGGIDNSVHATVQLPYGWNKLKDSDPGIVVGNGCITGAVLGFTSQSSITSPAEKAENLLARISGLSLKRDDLIGEADKDTAWVLSARAATGVAVVRVPNTKNVFYAEAIQFTTKPDCPESVFIQSGAESLNIFRSFAIGIPMTTGPSRQEPLAG